ncbi:MAG: hypothetical protein FJ009_16890 [Chloroflexi bacterium]|nr:hypothetical protein [Chloroflexota bacterium]
MVAMVISNRTRFGRWLLIAAAGLWACVLLFGGSVVERVHATYNNNPPAQPGFTHTPISGTDDRGYGLRLSGNVVRDSSPLLCDLDGNGTKEIVVGGIDGMIYAYRSNGTLLWSYAAVTPIYSSAACGDLKGNGQVAVVIGLGNKLYPGEPEIANGGVIALDGATGALRWRFNSLDDEFETRSGLTDVVYATPMLGDSDGDGKLEVFFNSWDRRFYALDADGKMLWQYAPLDAGWPSAAIADLDNDGFPEIIVGNGIVANAQVGTPNGGYLYVFNKDGTLRWKVYQDQTIYSSSAIGDINGDGYLDIVVGTGDYFAGMGKKIYAYDRNGNLLSGWPINLTSYVFSSPALADLNGDNIPEVIAGSADGKLYAWRGNGTQLWSSSPKATFGGVPNPFIGSPIAVDIGSCSFSGATNPASGSPSLLFGFTSEVVAVNSAGTQITDYPGNATGCTKTIWAEISVLQNSVAVGDIDNDGVLELVAASGNRYDPNRGYLYVWKISSATNAKLPWPQFRQNAQRTGVYPKANFTANFNDAAVFSNSIPFTMVVGSTVNATIAFRNTGSSIWTPSTVNLVPIAPDPLATASSYSLPYSVAPGGLVTFTIQLRASSNDTYAATNWRLNSIGTGTPFGLAATRRVKVGNQPSFYVLRGDGQIYNGGVASQVLTPVTTWNWDAARQLAMFYNGAGGYVFDLYGPWHYAPTSGMTYGPNEDLALIHMGYTSGSTESLREIDLLGSTYWQMDINGNFYAVGGQPLISGLPAAPGGGQAISFALTSNRNGVYVLKRDGSILRSTTATIVPNTPIFPGQDRFRKIKVTASDLGYYVMDKFGQVYNGGAAPAITPPPGFPAGSEVAVDFELTTDGKGYYLLTRDGAVHAAGTAVPILINPTPTWTVDINTGKVARDLVLVDSRGYSEPVLYVSPATVNASTTYGSGINPTFNITISNTGGPGTINWTATPPTNTSLSATSGSVTTSTVITGTVSASGYVTGTHSLGSIVFDGTLGGVGAVRKARQVVAGSPVGLPITLQVNGSLKIFLPLVIR